MKTRKFVAFMLAVILTAFPMKIFAADNISDIMNFHAAQGLTILYGNGEGSIEPMYEPVCGTYPYHKMMSSGIGYVFELDKPEYYIEGGCAWQCSRCMLVMVTQGDLYWWGMDVIGRYATDHTVKDPINSNGCIIFKADQYGYTDNNSLPGYQFYLVT